MTDNPYKKNWDKPHIKIVTKEYIYEECGDISTKGVLPCTFPRAWLQAQRHRKMMRIHSPKDNNKEEKQ